MSEAFALEMREHTLSYTAGANGSVEGETHQVVAYGTDGASVTASAATGFHFVEWSDGLTDNPRTDSNVIASVDVTATFAINTYTLTYAAGDNGSLTGEVSQTVEHDNDGSAVTAVAATGYHFVQWSDGLTVNPRTDSNVIAALTVTATFAINSYILTYKAGDNGSLTGETSQTVEHSNDGSAVTAVPDTGYHFVQWSDGLTVNPRTESNVITSVDVTATFEINRYGLTYAAGANGSLTGDVSQTIEHGSDGSAVTAVPDEGYHFVYWSDGLTVNPRTDSNVIASVDVTAIFAINSYTLSYAAGDNGSLTGEVSQTVEHGNDGSAVTAVPGTGYHFVQWSDGATVNPRTDINVISALTVTATFAINRYGLTYAAGDNGALTGEVLQTVEHGSNSTAVTAVADTGYHFVQWSDGVTVNPRTDSSVIASVDVTATFAINTYTLTYAASGNGSLVGEVSQTVNHGNAGTAVTAVPDTGYHFVQWSDGLTVNPRTDSSVIASLEVTATFVINSYTLSYGAGDNGSLTGDVSQAVNHGSDGSAVTAVPATGYHFLQWSDGVTVNPRTDSNVIASLDVTATFVINSYTLSYGAEDSGSLTGEVSQTVNHGSDGTSIAAVPDTGYYFVQWSDGLTVNPRTDSDVIASLAVTATFAINSYTLSYATGDNGSLTGEISQTVEHGNDGSAVTAVPDTGYHFVQWSDGLTVNPRTDSNVIAALTVTATFAINSYTLTYAAGANGSLTGEKLQTVEHGSAGSEVTAVSDVGYHFVEWSDGLTANPRTDSNVIASVEVTATFAINSYTLSYAAGDNGSLTGEVSQMVNHGSDGTSIAAVPDTGYYFVQWSDGLTVNPRTDSNVIANLEFTATFAINIYALSYTADANGSLTGDISQTVEHGNDGTAVAAVPDTGYHFVQWSDGPTVNPRTDSNVIAALTVTATFAINSYTLSYGAEDSGSLTGETSQTVNHGYDGSAITAVPDTGYYFVQWSDGLTVTTRTDSNVIAALTVTATFAINSYAITYTAGDNGSLTGDVSQTVNHGSGGSAVTAMPDTGYHFVQWSDGLTVNPRTDSSVIASLEVTATFVINSYTLSYGAGDNGSLTGDVSQAVNHGSDGSAVTAVPATGYHFLQWSDGVTVNPRTDSNIIASLEVTATFAINSYTLTYTAGDNGSLTGEISQTVEHGSDGTAVTAVPDTGYHFVQWSDGVETASRTDTNINAILNVTATFAINSYTLSYATGDNGSLTGEISQTVNHGNAGTAVTAVPDTGYHFVQWSDGLTVNPRTDGNVIVSVDVTATFAINSYTVSYAAGDNGSLTGEVAQTIEHGSDGTAVTAVPATGYHFAQWSDGLTVNPRTESNVIASVDVTATFAINSYTLTYAAGDNGSLTGEGSQTVNHGSDGSAVTAVPDTGYHFVQWSDGLTVNPRTDSNVIASLDITATFAINSYTLTYAASDNGSLTGEVSQTVEHGSAGSAVNAVPDTGYHFVQWSDGLTVNPRTDSNVIASVDVTATFAINVYNLAYAADEHGTLEGETTQQVEHGNSGSSVLAVPDEGYHFVQWSDGVTVAERTEANVTSHHTVTATFDINTYSVSYHADVHGTISGQITQTVAHGADGTAVAAVPEEGYHFVQWSDGLTINPRTDSNVIASVDVTATYDVNQYQVTVTSTPTAGVQVGSSTGHGGTTAYTMTVAHGTGVALEAPETVGELAGRYSFASWSGGVSSRAIAFEVAEAMTLTVVYIVDPVTYTVTFDLAGKGTRTGGGELVQSIVHGDAATAPTVVGGVGWTFTGWDVALDNVTAHLTVTAQYVVTTYTVTFDLADKGMRTGGGELVQTVTHGDDAIAPTVVGNTDWIFTGWDVAFDNVNGHLTVTAQYLAKTHNVVYKLTVRGQQYGQAKVIAGDGFAVLDLENKLATLLVRWADGSGDRRDWHDGGEWYTADTGGGTTYWFLTNGAIAGSTDLVGSYNYAHLMGAQHGVPVDIGGVTNEVVAAFTGVWRYGECVEAPTTYGAATLSARIDLVTSRTANQANTSFDQLLAELADSMGIVIGERAAVAEAKPVPAAKLATAGNGLVCYSLSYSGLDAGNGEVHNLSYGGYIVLDLASGQMRALLAWRDATGSWYTVEEWTPLTAFHYQLLVGSNSYTFLGGYDPAETTQTTASGGIQFKLLYGANRSANIGGGSVQSFPGSLAGELWNHAPIRQVYRQATMGGTLRVAETLHFNREEMGMQDAVEYLQERLPAGYQPVE